MRVPVFVSRGPGIISRRGDLWKNQETGAGQQQEQLETQTYLLGSHEGVTPKMWDFFSSERFSILWELSGEAFILNG